MHASNGNKFLHNSSTSSSSGWVNNDINFSQAQSQFSSYSNKTSVNVMPLQRQYGNFQQSHSRVGGTRFKEHPQNTARKDFLSNQAQTSRLVEMDQRNRHNFHAERKKLEQQQKLKAFSKVGIKSSIDADTFMNNMIGPTLAPKPVKATESVQSTAKDDGFGDFVQCEMVDKCVDQPSKSSLNPCETGQQERGGSGVYSTSPADASNRNPRKGLDVMMKQCSDLSISSAKPSSFQHKKTINEVTPAKVKTQQFVASNKACDWSKLCIDVGNSFVAPPPVIQPRGFPVWCDSEKVPDLYHKIEASVKNNAGLIDTGLLYPILMSSGLPQQLLAYIWSLANQTTPGQLTQQELYVALALIAVAQCGHPFQSADVLHSVPHPPIPNFFTQTLVQEPSSSSSLQSNSAVEVATQENSSGEMNQPSIKSNLPPDNSSDIDRQQHISTPCLTNDPDSALIPPGSTVITGSKPNFRSNEVHVSAERQSPKTEFGHYRRAMLDSKEKIANVDGLSLLDIAKRNEAKPVVNDSNGDDNFNTFASVPPADSKVSDDSDEFTDFQQSSCDVNPTSLHSSQNTFNNIEQPNPSDLISMEQDKYSVLRDVNMSSEQDNQKETGFGDFVHADPEELSAAEKISPYTNEVPSFQANFHQNEIPSFQADFSLFQSTDSASNDFGDFQSVDQNELSTKTVDDTNNSKKHDIFSVVDTQSTSSFEFGNFDSVNLNKDSLSVGSLDLDQNLTQSDLKQLKKDNISLGENQSIASLELATFEFGDQSSDSKSPVSKSDSTPSLELRVVSIDSANLNANDEFGDMLSAETCVPIEKSETIDKKPVDASYVLQNSGNSTFIVDKYSSVRSSEKLEVSDNVHGNEWMKCLKGCKEILDAANSIFSNISSSVICSEVLSSEEGSSYFKDVIEVYRVVRRVTLSINSFKKHNDTIKVLLKEINLIWNNLSAFMAGTAIMPEESSFDFSSGIFSHPNQDCTQLACGVCLLKVDSGSKAFNLQKDSNKLMYGGRQYHSSCANLWVNCVDLLLPSLPLPQLL